MRPGRKIPLVSVLAVFSVLGCGVESSPSDETTTVDGGAWDAEQTSSDPPKLHNFGVNLNQVVKASLLQTVSSDLPISLFGSPDPDGSGVRPNMAFRTQPSATVVSPLAATVERVLFQAGYGDWEIHLRSAAHPLWLTIVDHVVDLQVQAGQQVETGATLGAPTPWGPGYALVELHIIREPATPTEDISHVCPVPLVANALDIQWLDERLRAYNWPLNGCVCELISEVPGNDDDLFCDAKP